MTRLERRYRLLLRLLPGWYRTEREDEMVSTFLADRDDDLELEYGWPDWREAWAVAVLAVRVRQRGDAPARSVLIGDALRLVALGGLVAEASGAAGWLIVLLTVPGTDPGPHPYPAWLQVHLAGSLAIIVAFVLLLTGARAAAKTLAGLALLPGLLVIGTWNAPWSGIWQTVAILAPLWVTVGCLFAGFHEAAPVPRRRPWLIASAAATALGVTWVVVPRLVIGGWQSLTIFEPGSLRVLALALAVVVYLIARHRRDVDRSGTWALALTIGAAVLLVERLDYLTFTVDYERFAHDGNPLAVTAVQVAALAVALATLATISVRSLRRASPSPVPA